MGIAVVYFRIEEGGRGRGGGKEQRRGKEEREIEVTSK
jgi:hypothetical protein